MLWGNFLIAFLTVRVNWNLSNGSDVLYVVMEKIQDLSLSIKQVNIVPYKGSMSVTPCMFLGIDIEVIFCIDDFSVKVIIYNNFTRRFAVLYSFNPSLKIIQMRVNYSEVSFLYFVQVLILHDVDRSEIIFGVIGIILKSP